MPAFTTMSRIRGIASLLLAAAVLAGCDGRPEATARNIPLDVSAPGAEEIQDWSLRNIEVIVPITLTVSEANTIKPRADIVWREDPPGDRHSQVDAIVTEAMNYALSPMDGRQPVDVQINVTRFHALTERTRYTIGGEHEIGFIVTVRDAATGEVLRGPREVELIFPAYGGEHAVIAEAQGIFQRDRIQGRIIQWARTEFRLPTPANEAVIDLFPDA